MLIKKIGITILLILTVTSGYAVYLGENKNSSVLPAAASIPPLVSILDATDVNKVSESTPIRTFKIGSYAWTFEHDCAATLVGVDAQRNLSYLLTSAHCVTDPTKKIGVGTIDGPMNKRVIVGNRWCNLQSDNSKACITRLADSDETVYRVKQIFVDEKWFSPSKSDFINNDFAILSVAGILKINNQPIKPMMIAYKHKDWRGQQALFIAGWGTVSADALKAYQKDKTPMPMAYKRPNYAAVKSLPTMSCQTLMNSIQSWLSPGDIKTTIIDKDTQICTGDLAEVALPFKDSTICYGDSGGPLFAASNPNPNQWGQSTNFTLVGNVSGSRALCSPALCLAESPLLNTHILDPIKLNENCYNEQKNIYRISVPSIYGFPGSVLCAPDSLNKKTWLAVPDTWQPTFSNTLTAVSLNTLTNGGFQPFCDDQL